MSTRPSSPRPARFRRLLRYYLLRYQVLGLPVGWYLLAGLAIWVVDWLSGGALGR